MPLNPFRFAVLRLSFTEPAWSSPLNYGERSDGSFACAGCGSTLFDGRAKFDSGTGWPSFWRTAVDGCVKYNKPDWLGRVECHCGKCGGHLGHVFDDGPKPTGKRYCMNGVAMTFRAA